MVHRRRKEKKYCLVPFCRVNYSRNPDKMFFIMPKAPDLRELWVQACKRDPDLTGANSVFYCCEDHFDVEEDMANFVKFQLSNGRCRPLLKMGVIPHKFDCFKDKKVPSTFDLRKEKMILNEETMYEFLEPFDSPAYCNQNGENERMEDEHETRVTLEELNRLMVDVNNLGILSSVLNAYDQVYNDGTAWSLVFSVDNLGNSFSISIKKIGPCPATRDPGQCEDHLKQGTAAGTKDPADSLKKGVRNFRRKVEMNYSSDSTLNEFSEDESTDANGLFDEPSGEYQERFMDNIGVNNPLKNALVDGGHMYTNIMMMDKPYCETTFKRDGNKGNVPENEDVLPKERVATVYQCEYCCYGSLHKYRLVHHITTKHRARFTGELNQRKGKAESVTKEDETNETHVETNDRDDSKTKKTDILSKKKRLSYYLTSEKTHELNRLKQEIRSRSEWLDGFLKSFSEHSKVDVKPKSSNKIYPCALCDYTSNNQTEVYRHIGLSHTNENSAFTDCPMCDFKATDRKGLLSHLKADHPGETTFECKQCPYKTESNQNYFRHVYEVHYNVKNLKCDECGYVTARKTNLQKHIAATHRREYKFFCEEEGCLFRSTNQNSLIAHVKDIHQGIRPFICTENDCGYATGREFILKRHLYNAHSIGEPPKKKFVKSYGGSFPCLHCDKVFSRKISLMKHVRRHHLGLRDHYQCGECDFSSTNKPTVDTHIREVHRGYYPFKCDQCEFKTSVKQNFQLHYNAVHLKQKPYGCLYCDQRFAQRAHIVRHIRDIHLKEKPNLCAYCKFCTANRGNLKAHLKSIHKIPEENVKQVLEVCINLRKQEPKDQVFDKVIVYENEELVQNEEMIYENEEFVQYEETVQATQLIQEISLEI